jgi:hypothetical protein
LVQFDEHKRNRADLAGYFVRNAIPTEANFSDLIASGLNQRDDGIAKPADGPISLQGVDERGLRRVLNVYQDFSDDMPQWTLSVQGADNVGLGIGRGSDDSVRLFIEMDNGFVGIGTTQPLAEFDVNGSARVRGVFQPSAGPDGGIQFPYDAFGGSGDLAYLRWVTRGTPTPESTTLELGVENDADDHVAVMASGCVGINTRTPVVADNRPYKVDLHGPVELSTSEIYFTGTTHEHSAWGNDPGHAAIENDSRVYNALMILGRQVGTRRKIQMWDDVNCMGTLAIVGNLVNASDARLKENIEDSPHGLDAVNRLRPVVFEWRDQPNPHRTIGLLAQEVREVLDEVVHGDEETGESLGIAYSSLIPVLINAVQELDRRLTAALSDRGAASA